MKQNKESEAFIFNFSETQRLGDDRRSCIPVYCDELEIKCSHECVDKDEGNPGAVSYLLIVHFVFALFIMKVLHAHVLKVFL
jgi:hypothetical protein